jgi:hypothetical protein
MSRQGAFKAGDGYCYHGLVKLSVHQLSAKHITSHLIALLKKPASIATNRLKDVKICRYDVRKEHRKCLPHRHRKHRSPDLILR